MDEIVVKLLNPVVRSSCYFSPEFGYQLFIKAFAKLRVEATKSKSELQLPQPIYVVLSWRNFWPLVSYEYYLYMWNAIKWLGNLTHSVVGPWQSILFQVSLQHIFLDYCSASLSRLKPPPAKSQASVPCSKASFNAPSSIFPSTPWYDLCGLDEGTWPWNRHV